MLFIETVLAFVQEKTHHSFCQFHNTDSWTLMGADLANSKGIPEHLPAIKILSYSTRNSLKMMQNSTKKEGGRAVSSDHA